MAAKTDLTHRDIRSGATFVQIEAATAYQFARGEIAWQDVVASEIILDPDTLNRYFRDDAVSFNDAASLGFTKTNLDSFGFSDSQVVEVQKGLIDAFAFSEDVTILLTILRDFDDSFAISDVSVLSIDKGVVDSIPLTDVFEMAVSVAKSDALSMTEEAQLGVSKAESDSVSVTDNFARSVTYVRALSDQFALDDSATVDAFSKETGSNKVNVFTFADTQVLAVAKAPSDSIPITDVFARVVSFDRDFNESVTFGENVSVSLLTTVSSVLATSALNTYSLNS
jgi:uncharacterized protein YlxP (DUF503 family)